MKTTRFKTLRAYVQSFKQPVTQRHIASVLGVTEPELSEYLSGRKSPSKAVALRLYREHRIDLEGLLDPTMHERRAS